MDYRELNLNNLNSGAVSELFEEEMDKLIKNIADDNTNPKAKRSITIKIEVKPSADRGKADTTVTVKSNLAPIKPHESFIVLSNDGNRIRAYTADIKQKELDLENVTPMVAGMEK